MSLRVCHATSRHVSQSKHALCRAGMAPDILLHILSSGHGAYTPFFTLAESILILDAQNILLNSPYWLNFEELWSTWPSRQLSGELKWYFLVQLAFYLQALLAINLEERRKDFGQMFLHHCVTSFLMYVAYAYRWTNVGNVILCIMDVVDFLLPVCKPCGATRVGGFAGCPYFHEG